MPAQTIAFNQDATGTNPANLVIGEIVLLTPGLSVRGAAPIYGAFYTESVVVHDVANNALLVRGVDYQCVELLQDATLKFGKEICMMILIINPLVSASIRIDYQVVGGSFQNAAGQMVNLYETVIKDNRVIDWLAILNKPLEYNPALHQHLLADVYGFEAVVTALERIRNAIILSDVPAFESLAQWCMDQINIVKASVNLVENLPVVTVDEVSAGLPVHSYLTHDRLLTITEPLNTHAANLLNPHNTSAQQIGLGSVENLAVVTNADIALGVPVHKYVTHDMLLKISANQPPQLGLVSFINLNTLGATAQVAVTAVNGYNSPTAVVTFYYRDVAGLGPWIALPTIPFKNTQLVYQTILTGLASGSVYGVYATITDPNNPPLIVQTLEAQFTTYGLAVDADSSFDITGATFIAANLDIVDADIVSFTAIANREQATVASNEIVQQNGQLDFIKLVPTASFKPEEIRIDSTSILPTLKLTSQESNLQVGNDLYTVDTGGVLTESVISSIVTEGEYPVINLNTDICNAPWQQNNGALTTLKDLGTWTLDTPLPFSGYGTCVLTTNSFVYRIGGQIGVTPSVLPTNAIYRAPINNDGTIGAWVLDPIVYPTAIMFATSYMVGNRFYVCGGMIGALSTQITAVSYYTIINADGTIGAWVLDVPYPFGMYYGNILVSPSRVNSVGGVSAGGSNTLSYSRIINADNTLGPWVASTAYPISIDRSAYFVTDTTAYILGGNTGQTSTVPGTSTSMVGMAPVLMDGTLGPWSWSKPFPIPLYYGRVVQTRNRVWIVTASLIPAVSDCYYADILVDGTLGDWIKGTALPGTSSEGQLFQTSTRLYLIAGANAGGTPTANIFSVNWDGWVISNDSTVIEALSPLPALVEINDNVGSNYNPHHTTTSLDLVWSSGTPMPVPQLHSCIVRTTTNAYVLGGHTVYPSGTSSVNVWRAPINPDGTLGAWVGTGQALPYPVTGATVVIIKNRVYVFSGLDGATNLQTTKSMYAAILADGTLGAWTLSPKPLAMGAIYSQVFKTKNRVYITGGVGIAGNGSTGVQYAPILPNGDLGAWVADVNLPGTYCLGDAVVTSTRVYLLGGTLNSLAGVASGSVIVYTAELLADGSIGPWLLATPLPAPCAAGGIVVTANRIWILGGYASVGGKAVYRAEINPDGTLGAWTLSPNPLAAYQATTRPFVTKTHVYLLGSNSPTGTAWLPQVQVAPFDGWDLLDNNNIVNMVEKPINTKRVTGHICNSTNQNPWFTTKTTSLPTWTAETAFPTPIKRSHSVVTSTRVYMLGGSTVNSSDSTNNIYYAPIDVNGNIGKWVLDVNKLPIPLISGGVVKTKSFVFIMGGSTTGNLGPFTTIYSAPINPDGTLGVWTLAGSTGNAFVNNKLAVLGDQLYLFGSFYLSNGIPAIFTGVNRYGITPDGKLTAPVLHCSMPAAIVNFEIVVTKSRLYLIGGDTSANGAYVNTIYSATVDAKGMLGTTWVTETPFPVAGAARTALVTANRAWLIGGAVAGNVSVNLIYTAPIDSEGKLGTWVIDTVTLPPQTGCWHQVVVTKSKVYLIGGDNSVTPLNTITSCPFDGWSNTDSGYVKSVPRVTNYLSEPSAQRYDVATTNTNLAGWITETPMPAGLILGGVLTTTTRVYKIGGRLNGVVNTPNVYSAPIDANGVLGAWVLDTPLPGTLFNHKIIKTKNRVYTVGGIVSNVASTIPVPCYTAVINLDGTLGPWSVAKSLPDVRYTFGLAITKSKAYLLGGINGSGAAINTTLVANINADGTLGAWVTANVLPYFSNYWMVTFVTRNYMYIVGGNMSIAGAPPTLGNIGYYAYIKQDGTLGPWVALPVGNNLPINLDVCGVVTASNRVWLIGGVGGVGLAPINTVYTAPIDVNGMLSGPWVTDSTLPATGAFIDAVVTKSKIYLLGMDPTSTNATNAQPTVYSTNFAGWENQNYGSRVHHTVNTVVPLVNPLPVKAFKGGQLLQGYISNLPGAGVLLTPLLVVNVISNTGVVTQTSEPIISVGRYARVSLTLNLHDICSEIKGDLWHG